MDRERRWPAVYFLSDYGTDDEFVGVVHAVLHRLAPRVPVIDLGHGVPPFDIGSGAAMLVRSAPHLGEGVVLAVVDPGVGTDRRAVAVEVEGPGPDWLVGPDNGLLVPMAGALGAVRRVVELRRATSEAAQTAAAGPAPGARAVSEGRTFDGRDLFAPAAAHLVTGAPPSELGSEVDPGSLLPLSDPGGAQAIGVAGPDAAAAIEIPVTWVDRFGNIQLAAVAADLERIGLHRGGTAWLAMAGERPGLAGVRARSETRIAARWVDAFGDLAEDELGLIIDSNGRCALVLPQASAARRLRVGAGEAVRIASSGGGPAR